VLNAAWYTGGFEQNYWPQCALLVERFRDHDALFCWEVGNEMKLSENKPAFIAFMQTIRQRIRALDPNHMISTGMISTRHTGIDQNSAQADQLYAGFDIVSQHSYNESDADTQVQLAARLGKPLVIGEVGYDVRNYSTEGRNQALVRDLEKWFGRGVAGIMQWGFQAQTRDIGDGDRYVGMDRYSVTNSPHYPFYVQTYSGRASWLRANPPAGTPCPTVTPTPPPYQSLIEIR
jgi:endo-1,4-beta-mannosidase